YQLYACPKPTNLIVKAGASANTLTLGWKEYSGRQDSWDVAYKRADDADFTIVEGVTQHPCTVTDVEEGVEYTFKVRSRKTFDGKAFTSKWSDEVPYPLMDNITLANDATDNGATVTENDGELCNVTLANRTIYRDGDWNTLVLPFEVDLTDEDSPLFGATARTLASASLTNNGQTLTLNFDEPITRLEAGVPYIIKWTEKCETDIVNPVFPYVTIDATDNTFCSDDRLVRFVGTYDLVTFDDENKDVLFLGGGNNLYYPDGKATTTIGACRAYFKIGNDDFVADAAQLRSIVMDFGEESETVTIENVRVTKDEEIWFTLDGRRLKGKPNEKGLFIHNGKTVVE
nr:fibronectin type III domain-containing protein [Bacteroidales bacterium]